MLLLLEVWLVLTDVIGLYGFRFWYLQSCCSNSNFEMKLVSGQCSSVIFYLKYSTFQPWLNLSPRPPLTPSSPPSPQSSPRQVVATTWPWMNNKSRIVAKKASQRHAVCSDPNYASQSGIIGVKLGAGLLGRAKISLSATYYLPLEHLL